MKDNKRSKIEEQFATSVQLSKTKRQLTTEANASGSDGKPLPAANSEKTKGANNQAPGTPTPSSSAKKNIQNVVIELYEKSEKIYSSLANDAGKDLDKYLNSPNRRPSVLQEYGDVTAIVNMLSNHVKESLDLLSKIPSPTKHKDMYLGTQLDEIETLKNTLNAAKNSATLPDLMTTVLSIRPSLTRLLSTINILEADPGLLDDKMFIENYLVDGKTQAAAFANRDTLADNATMPDRTYVKPIFLLFIDDSIKYELKKLKVSNVIIDALDNFSIPSFRWSEELGSEQTLYSGKSGNENVAYDPSVFAWSKNGTDKKSLRTPSAYVRNTQEFLNQIKAKYKLAISKSLMEYTYDMAVLEVLTSWLNGAFKAIVEANLGTHYQILKGIQFERDRMFPIDNASLAFRYLTETSDPSVGTKGPIPALFDTLSQGLKANISRKVYYNEFAYSFVKKEFRTLTYSIDDKATKYYVGSTLIGNHKIKINILPKLYLPVNLKSKLSVDVVLPDSSIMRTANAFNFQLQISNSFYISARDERYNSTIVVFSILHELFAMTNSEFNSAFESYLTNRALNTFNGKMVYLKDLFSSAFTVRRELSSIPPYYLKDVILEKVPTAAVNVELPDTAPEGVTEPEAVSKWFWPHLDMALMKNVLKNDNGWFSPNIAYKMGDVIRGLFNLHGDFSWIEMGVVAAMIMDSEVIAIKPKGTNGNFLTLPSSSNSADLISALRTSAHPDTAQIVERRTFGRIMNVHQWTLQYTLKENISAIQWFEDFDYQDTSAIKPTLISKEDINLAERYQFFGTYLVDMNQVNSKTTIFPITYPPYGEGGYNVRIRGAKKYLVEGKSVKITESEIRSALLDPNILNGGILLYNTNPNLTCVALNPVRIPHSDLIGYEVTGSFTLARINELVYIKDNFFPTWRSYSISLPTNSHRDSSKVNNIHPARFVSHALLATGVLQNNISDAMRIIAASFGLPNRNHVAVLHPYTYSDFDRSAEFYKLDTLAIDYMTQSDFADVDDDERDGMTNSFGFQTSKRYSSFLHYSVYLSPNARFNTGFYGVLKSDEGAYISQLKSDAYMAMFGLLPISRHHQSSLRMTTKADVIPLTLQVGTENLDQNLKVALKQYDIIKLLDLEDPEHVYAY